MWGAMPEWITALVTATSAVTAIIIWLLNCMPDFNITIKHRGGFEQPETSMLLVILTPNAVRHPYQILRISADTPLFQGDYQQGNYTHTDKPFTLDKPLFIPSKSQRLQGDPICFFIDAAKLANQVEITLSLKLKHFPFYCRKRIEIII